MTTRSDGHPDSFPRTKNNTVLIGELWVGKTAIVKGLSQRVVRGDVPDGLKNKKVIALDMGAPMDAGNLLKPMLARGELHCIGATTLDEHRKHIEKDAALERCRVFIGSLLIFFIWRFEGISPVSV